MLGLILYQRESQNGLESTENRRSVGRNGNQHVYVRDLQLSGAARTSRQSPVSNGGLSCWVCIVSWSRHPAPAVGGCTDARAINQHSAHAGGAHLAEGDFLRVGGHGIPELNCGHCTSGQCTLGQLSLTGSLSLDGWVPWRPIRTLRDIQRSVRSPIGWCALTK